MPSGNSEHRLDRIIAAIEADLQELKHRRDADAGQTAKEAKRRRIGDLGLRAIDGGKSRAFILILGLLGLVRALRAHPAITAAAAITAGVISLGVVLLPNVIGGGGRERHGAIPTAPAPPAPSASHPSPTPSPTHPSPRPSGTMPTTKPMPTSGEATPGPPGTMAMPAPPASSPPATGTPPVSTEPEPIPTPACLLDVNASVTLLDLRAAVRLGLCGSNVT